MQQRLAPRRPPLPLYPNRRWWPFAAESGKADRLAAYRDAAVLQRAMYTISSCQKDDSQRHHAESVRRVQSQDVLEEHLGFR